MLSEVGIWEKQPSQREPSMRNSIGEGEDLVASGYHASSRVAGEPSVNDGGGEK